MAAYRTQAQVDNFGYGETVRGELLEERWGPPASLPGFYGMVGQSQVMQELFSTIKTVAPHYRSALLRGETGTGKELVARALHQLSPASRGHFVALNCSAIVETLFESELFGYVKGAFTGAVQDKMGLFEYANGGTILLDEISDMPLAAQAKLLRVLQFREVQRLGSPVPRPLDVRVIAVSQRDLRELVEQKRFRKDLYYRLAMIEIKVPSLAARKEDLPALEQHFLRRFALECRKPVRGFTARVQAVLREYSWPGNVRELENVVGHACMVCQGELIDVPDLPAWIWRSPVPVAQEPRRIVPLIEMERIYARDVVRQLGGNKARAAAALRIGRNKLYSLLNGDTGETREN